MANQSNLDLVNAVRQARLASQLLGTTGYQLPQFQGMSGPQNNPVQGPAAGMMGASPRAINSALTKAGPSGAPAIPLPSSSGGAPAGNGANPLMGMTGAQFDQMLGKSAVNSPIQGPAGGLPMGASPAMINAALAGANPGGPAIPPPPPVPANAQSYL